jgi:hypothetical protein
MNTLLNLTDKLTQFLSHNPDLTNTTVLILDENGEESEAIEIEFREGDKAIYIKTEWS